MANLGCEETIYRMVVGQDPNFPTTFGANPAEGFGSITKISSNENIIDVKSVSWNIPNAPALSYHGHSTKCNCGDSNGEWTTELDYKWKAFSTITPEGGTEFVYGDRLSLNRNVNTVSGTQASMMSVGDVFIFRIVPIDLESNGDTVTSSRVNIGWSHSQEITGIKGKYKGLDTVPGMSVMFEYVDPEQQLKNIVRTFGRSVYIDDDYIVIGHDAKYLETPFGDWEEDELMSSGLPSAWLYNAKNGKMISRLTNPFGSYEYTGTSTRGQSFGARVGIINTPYSEPYDKEVFVFEPEPYIYSGSSNYGYGKMYTLDINGGGGSSSDLYLNKRDNNQAIAYNKDYFVFTTEYCNQNREAIVFDSKNNQSNIGKEFSGSDFINSFVTKTFYLEVYEANDNSKFVRFTMLNETSRYATYNNALDSHSYIRAISVDQERDILVIYYYSTDTSKVEIRRFQFKPVGEGLPIVDDIDTTNLIMQDDPNFSYFSPEENQFVAVNNDYAFIGTNGYDNSVGDYDAIIEVIDKYTLRIIKSFRIGSGHEIKDMQAYGNSLIVSYKGIVHEYSTGPGSSSGSGSWFGSGSGKMLGKPGVRVAFGSGSGSYSGSGSGGGTMYDCNNEGQCFGKVVVFNTGNTIMFDATAACKKFETQKKKLLDGLPSTNT